MFAQKWGTEDSFLESDVAQPREGGPGKIKRQVGRAPLSFSPQYLAERDHVAPTLKVPARRPTNVAPPIRLSLAVPSPPTFQEATSVSLTTVPPGPAPSVPSTTVPPVRAPSVPSVLLSTALQVPVSTQFNPQYVAPCTYTLPSVSPTHSTPLPIASPITSTAHNTLPMVDGSSSRGRRVGPVTNKSNNRRRHHPDSESDDPTSSMPAHSLGSLERMINSSNRSMADYTNTTLIQRQEWAANELERDRMAIESHERIELAKLEQEKERLVIEKMKIESHERIVMKMLELQYPRGRDN